MALAVDGSERFIELSVAAGVEADPFNAEDHYATLYAVGPGYHGEAQFDMEPGRRLIGYEPHVQWPDEAPFDVPFEDCPSPPRSL